MCFAHAKNLVASYYATFKKVHASATGEMWLCEHERKTIIRHIISYILSSTLMVT